MLSFVLYLSKAKIKEIGYFNKYDNFVILEYVEMLVYNDSYSSMA